MKKFLKDIWFAGMIGVAAVLSSCGCPEFNTEPNPDPSVREATITEFNPNFTTPTGVGGDTISVPVPQYSVHTFQFPNNIASSGSLPNDNRLSGGRKLVLGEQDTIIDNERYTVQLVSNIPTNESLIGDILVSQVTNVTGAPGDRRARLRIYGSMGQYSDDLNSASAGDFATYLRRTDVKGETEDFGTGQGVRRYGTTNAVKLDMSDIRVVRASDSINTVDPRLQGIADRLLNMNIASIYEIEVKIGEVYYYRARNGIEFGVLIEDIRQGSIAPNLNRVTIKFAELKGPSCEP